MLIEILTRFMQYDGHGGGMLMIQHMGGGEEQDVDGFCGKIQERSRA